MPEDTRASASSPLDPLYAIVGWLLAVLYYPTHSLGLAIIVLTLIVMFVQLPLIAKQTRSMILMQRVQPEIKKIQQKYKDDRAKQNEELLKYYQENKINPLAGCLPLLLILPIGIAVLGTFRHPGIQYHIPRSGTFSKLYIDICGNTKIDPGAMRSGDQGTARHRPCTSSACTSTCRPRTSSPTASAKAYPVLHLVGAGHPHRLVPGAPDPGPPGKVGRRAGRTRRCRPSRRSCRSSSG